MINFLQGKMEEKNPAYVVINCNGVGYLVNISLNTYNLLGSNENVKILTYLSIKEDSHTLYGFATSEEREIFRLLISVNGVGTNTARMILSSLTTKDLNAAIITGDVSLLKSIKGIGPKSAQRIVLELQDKMGKIETDSVSMPASGGSNYTEALSALSMLGFQKNQADKVLKKILQENGDESVEELIRKSLKNL